MHASWYFDFISPYAYLQLPRVCALTERVDIDFKPILFAGLLDYHANRGPAEIPSKRRFTYRFTQWRAEQLGIVLKYPPAHPFNPLTALRLAIAAGSSRPAVTAIFQHIWRDGRRGDDPASLAPVARRLGIESIEQAVSAPEVKDRLRSNFDSAVAEGVFGVPTLAMNGQLFWGDDATPMFEQYLENPALFDEQEMRRLDDLPVGAHRRKARA
jgi:2-hydroxychromene-2-carboxylate isomerase